MAALIKEHPAIAGVLLMVAPVATVALMLVLVLIFGGQQ